MFIRSLRTEIAVLALTSIITISALVLWFAVSAYEVLYQKSAQDDLNGLSENLSVDLITNLDEKDNFAISNALLKLDQYKNVRFAAVLSHDGELLSSYLGNAITRGKTNDEILTMPTINFGKYHDYSVGMTISSKSILAKKPIGDIQAKLGYLVIEKDLSKPLDTSKRNLLWSTLPWVTLAMLINIIIIIVFQKRALKPLTQLAKFTQKIRDTKNYSLIATVAGKREISTVTIGINSMMNEINSEVEKNKHKNKLLLSQQETMEKLANYDVLTGLVNRQFFMKKLNLAMIEAKQKQADITLMFFDLDGFKRVNDSFGHEIGDQLLCETAKRILDTIEPIKKCATAARFGGDEFLVFINHSTNTVPIYDIAKRFIASISQPVTIEQWKVQIGASIGIANAKGAHYNQTELVANADVAMYQAKNNGRNRYEQFSGEMIEKSRRKLNIANAIDNALVSGEFTLFYQPKVDRNGKIMGYEALARWFNEDLGHISPAEFIPIAEQSGKISQVTGWLIKQVCHDITHIFEEPDCKRRIALNLSVHDLKDQYLVHTIKQHLHSYNVAPEQIEFEITESAYLDNFSSANSFIEELKCMGCTIALDDFGTGYSSLSYLTQINIDTLKIDKQFVEKICQSKRDALITKTIIDMAKQLNIKVCAEGVETIEQSQKLIDYGCDTLQGYYYAKPMNLEAVLIAKKHSL